MGNNRVGWALIGFLIGAGMGSGLGYLCLLLFNWICGLLDKPAVAITWGQVLPLGILMGISMALNIVHSPFGD